MARQLAHFVAAFLFGHYDSGCRRLFYDEPIED